MSSLERGREVLGIGYLSVLFRARSSQQDLQSPIDILDTMCNGESQLQHVLETIRVPGTYVGCGRGLVDR